jgi:DNA-binding CsgD family transcriptional regulator
MHPPVGSLLTTLEGATSSQRRQSLVEQFAALVDVDFAAYFDLTPTPDGLCYDHMTCAGSREVRERWLGAQGTRSVAPWDPRTPSRGVVNRFKPGADVGFRKLGGASVFERYYLPFGLCRERRILVYRGETFHGWLGGSRQRDRPFSRREMGRLKAATQRLINLVVGERHLRDEGPPADDGMVLLKPNGRVEMSCETAARWLDEERREAMAHHVRRLERDPTTPTSFVASGLVARLLRLSGDGAARYVCSLEAPAPLERSPTSRLSPRQREIAELLVAGATTSEVASHFDVAATTVQDHVKAIYRRLEVSSRVELARVLGDRDSR